MKKTFIFLFLIVILASVLRLWQIGSIPISPDWDEVALGYNGYSIMRTGRDEYGKFLPVVLRSFDDYKPALYAYLTIPFIGLFDLSVVAIRLPSAIFGILTVLAIFYLIRELFKKDSLALFSSFILAISPWHIQFSRIGFESNVGLALNVFTALFFIKGLKKPWMLILSVISAALALYVYQSEKVFTPLLIFVLIILYRKELFRISKKYLISAVVIGLVVSLPILSYTLTNRDALARAKGVSIFSQPPSFLQENSQRILTDTQHRDLIGLVFDNRRWLFGKLIIANYLSHFNLNWLFITGDIARHHAPNMGLLYLIDLPFLFIGLYQLLFGQYDKRTKLLILIWVITAPIPAAVTTGVPHAVRDLNVLPMLTVLVSIGLLSVFVSGHKVMKGKNLLYLFILIFYVFNFAYYLDQYFVQQNYYTAYDWQYGYAKILPEVSKISNNYKKIIVSNQPQMDQSYMFFLFYLKYPPVQYLSETSHVSGGFKENHLFGKYEFRPIDWSKEKKESDILYVGRPSDFPTGSNILSSVNYPNGEEDMKIVKGH